MQISASMVKELREKTGAGILDCKEALAENEGNMEEAIAFLRKKGLADAKKRASRTASEGIIGSYIHSNGKIGVLVEINCETDFVARTDEFKELTKDIAMQVAASQPRFVSPEEIPEDVESKEKEILSAQAKDTGKPDNVIEKIVEGKYKKFLSDNCLLMQPFIKDTNMTVQQVVDGVIAKLGENIQVRRFVRLQMGEGE